MIAYSDPTTVAASKTMNGCMRVHRPSGPSRNDSSNINIITSHKDINEDRALRDDSNTRNPISGTTTVDISRDYVSPRKSSSSNRATSNPNFSIPLTGSPSNRKHRPSPLDLSQNSNRAGVGRSQNETVSKDRMNYSKGGSSPQPPKLTMA